MIVRHTAAGRGGSFQRFFICSAPKLVYCTVLYFVIHAPRGKIPEDMHAFVGSPLWDKVSHGASGIIGIMDT